MDQKFKVVAPTIVIISIFLLSAVILPLQNSSNSIVRSSGQPISSNPDVISQTGMAMVPIETSCHTLSNNASYPFHGNVFVMVTFKFQNQSKLNSLLSNISNPNSHSYHQYISRSKFASEFSVSQNFYLQAESYFSQFTGVKITTFSDRISMEVQGPSSIIGKAFNTSIAKTSGDSISYFTTSSPELPKFIASHVSKVSGLSNKNLHLNNFMFNKNLTGHYTNEINTFAGYPQPLTVKGIQNIYGSDLQVAYDEQTLLNITYPTNEVIATILWAGQNSSNQNVGAFNPSDIYSYFNSTIPSYEPHSKLYGVPLNGAVKPGASASYDKTGANIENTLDLEMVGSTAPGSSIYNVYGPNATIQSIDSSLAYILNPNSTYSALNNVSVISNSWGAPEFNNTVWYQYLQEAQARGISVLASSGDSGDNNKSQKYSPNTNYTNDYVQFPASMAYDNFGVTSVGGTTLTLAGNLHILNQTAWYATYSSTSGNPAGSVGGISMAFKETSWQLNSKANNILKGAGLGVPDISAIGNNTLIILSINGTSNLYSIGGTSVSSPVEAGIVAEMNAVLGYYNQSKLGYLNPLLYNISNYQFSTPKNTPTTGFFPTGNYNASIPTLPFYNIIYGRNHIYNASYAYNLVTGWGSIDADNLTMYALHVNRNLSSFGLKGINNVINLTGLNVTSYLYNSSTGKYSTVNKYFNASIQQNFFLANELGAPVYWIQNVVYINRSAGSSWAVNYTGWSVYPFYGQYPSKTLYRYNFPLGHIISMPHTFNITSWISTNPNSMNQVVYFEINSHVISLPVPGAAYIIDSYNYTYSMQGHTYYNGPFPDNKYSGGLDPQFGLVGGPSGGNGTFINPTAGTITGMVEPMNSNNYVPAVTKVFNNSIDQTGEVASRLVFTKINNNTWNISTGSNSYSQGILICAPAQQSVTFRETGLAAGTLWYVNLSSGQIISTTSNYVTISEPDGTYSFKASNLSGYYTMMGITTFTIINDNITKNVSYLPWAHIAGIISPGNANISLNGKAYPFLSSGKFNLSVPGGTYQLKVSELGYISYYHNFTMKPGNYTYISIVLNKTPGNSPFGNMIYIYLLAGGIIFVVLMLLAYERHRRK